MNFLSIAVPKNIEHLQDDTEKYQYKKQHSGNPTENSGPSAAAIAETSHHGDLGLDQEATGKIRGAVTQRVGLPHGAVLLGLPRWFTQCCHPRTIAHNHDGRAIL
jgi:hypothetical protein